MTLFSDNPKLEQMMRQKPTGRQVLEATPAPAPDSPCYQCSYGGGAALCGVLLQGAYEWKEENCMKLVIAEKPDVAQSLAAVLGAKERGQGYLQGNGYIVSRVHRSSDWTCCCGQPMTPNIPIGAMRIYRLFRSIGNIRLPRTKGTI